MQCNVREARNLAQIPGTGSRSLWILTTYTTCSDRIPDWLTNADGQEWENVVWQEVRDKLEQIEPGCLSWVSSASG